MTNKGIISLRGIRGGELRKQEVKPRQLKAHLRQNGDPTPISYRCPLPIQLIFGNNIANGVTKSFRKEMCILTQHFLTEFS